MPIFLEIFTALHDGRSYHLLLFYVTLYFNVHCTPFSCLVLCLVFRIFV
jgi:hypothetical protein